MRKKNDVEKDIENVENKVPKISGVLTSFPLNTKAIEIENKWADIIHLGTNANLNQKVSGVENKYLILLLLLHLIRKL